MTDNILLQEINRKLDDLVKANSEQNERLARTEEQAKNNTKAVEDVKQEMDRRFAMVWKVGLGVASLAIIVVCSLVQGGVIG